MPSADHGEKSARADGEIDWIVVCMHQVAISSAHLNGADFGIRQEFMPLFGAYGVDLVVAGHEHHYERTFPVRGVLPGSSLLTPAPRGSDPAGMDTRDGTVHMIIGGGRRALASAPGRVGRQRGGRSRRGRPLRVGMIMAGRVAACAA